jgi:YaiO family outer membrane protein
MFTSLAAALILVLTLQASPADRDRAEQLARSGQTAEALALFERIAAERPSDLEVRQWIARLQLRMGRVAEAEAGFRAVLLAHPSDIDARIGVGAALTRRNAWAEALTILQDAERDAGENADLFAALARAYRRAGDDRRALEYYERARTLAPGDPDLVAGYEATRRVYGSSITVEGVGEGGVSDARSASLSANLRVMPRLELEGRARVQHRSDDSDTLAGAGAIWRVNRSTNLAVRFGGGVDNTSLPNGDLTTEVRHYRGAFELGGNFRYLSFSGVSVAAASPLLGWDTGERWRLDARYTYSRSLFETTGQSAGDHSALLRETFRAWRRVDLAVTYAYGIESFEDLTADRIRNLGAHTVAATLQFRLPSITTVATTWERQLRANDTRLDRLTIVMVQGFR